METRSNIPWYLKKLHLFLKGYIYIKKAYLK